MKRWALLLLLAMSWVEGQSARLDPADSLRALLRGSLRSDTLRVRRLTALAEQDMAGHLTRADSLLQASVALAQRLHFERGELSALINLGTVARLQARYPAARRYTYQALAIAARLRSSHRLAQVYLQLNLLEAVPGHDLAAALRSGLRGLDYATQAGDSLTTAQLRYAIGNVYYLMGDYASALPALRQALASADRLRDGYVQAATLALLGSAQQQLAHWPQARAYFRQAARLNQQLGDVQSATACQVSLAELAGQQGRYAEALRYGRAARAQARASHDSYNLPGAELALASAFLHLEQADSAAALAGHAYAQGRRSHDNATLAPACHLLAQAYARQQQFAAAYRYQSQWVGYRDSLAGEAT